jgi:hypothetical protein
MRRHAWRGSEELIPDMTLPQPLPVAKPKPSKAKLTTLPETLDSAREAMNREFCLIERLPGIAVIPTLDDPEIHVYSRGELIQTVCSDRIINGQNVASSWMTWPKRNKCLRLAYAPGKEQFFRNQLNTWVRSSINPIEGDLSLWFEYLEHVFSSDPTNRSWLIQWLAYQFQHPGIKMFSAVVFWSKETSTGKSLFGYIMAELFGHHNFSEISEGELHGNFNHWAARKQFVMGEEIKGSNAQRHADALKAIITRKFVTINTKNTPHYTLPDCINYFFTSNHAEAFFLENTDRRFFVHQLPEKKLAAEWVHNTFMPWLKAGGYGAILYWLLNIDLTGFSPTSAAPHTAARKEMIDANRSELELWWEELLESLDTPLVLSLDDLWNSYNSTKPKERKGQFKRWIKPKLSILYSGHQIRVDGYKVRVFAILPLCEAEIQNTEVVRLNSLTSEQLSHNLNESRGRLRDRLS